MTRLNEQPPKLLTATQFAKATGATPRQLQWWDERGFLKPAVHARHRRQYDPDQRKIGRLFVELGHRSGPRLGKVVRLLKRRRMIEILQRFVAVRADGMDVVMTDQPDELLRFLAKSNAAWLAVEAGS